MTIQDAAAGVNQNITNNNEVFLDPLTLYCIISIIGDIIGAIHLYCMWKQNKDKAQQIIEVSTNPGLIARLMVSRQVRKHMSSDAFRQNGQTVIDAIFQTAATTSQDDLEELLSQNTTDGV